VAGEVRDGGVSGVAPEVEVGGTDDAVISVDELRTFEDEVVVDNGITFVGGCVVSEERVAF
jgi:hypothetical protein